MLATSAALNMRSAKLRSKRSVISKSTAKRLSTGEF